MMIVDFSKLDGKYPNEPLLQLRTLSGKIIGNIPFVSELKFTINYSDTSEISFETPMYCNGIMNPVYDELVSYRVVYTDSLGIYIISNPEKSGDGIQETKQVTGYSIEKLLEKKQLYLEEGTFNFWNPTAREDTILQRILELDESWSPGYVAPDLIGKYRTFDEYSGDMLSFCYSNAAEIYNCVFVFDVYKRTINVYMAEDPAIPIPVYLTYENLVEQVDVKEITDDMVTKLHVFGADEMSIRDVNPLGQDYIVDLSYFLSVGDLDVIPTGSSVMLSEKVKTWQQAINTNMQKYIFLTSCSASNAASRIQAVFELNELKGEMEVLVAQQSVIIQGMALEDTDDGIAFQQKQLYDVNAKIKAKQAEIDKQQEFIDGIDTSTDSYKTQINAIIKALSFDTYFTTEEKKILTQYFIEGDLTEETFVATSINPDIVGSSLSFNGSVVITGSEIVKANIGAKEMYSVTGGKIAIGNANVNADIIRGTLEVTSNTSFILSLYLGNGIVNGDKATSGMLTVHGDISNMSNDIKVMEENQITENKGTKVSFTCSNGKLYFTPDTTDYQKYAVAKELYDYGKEQLGEMAWPVYEFTINSANFLYADKFKPFKNELQLGRGVYLNIGSEGRVVAKLIGITIDYSDITSFDMVFSNQYQRRDGIEILTDTIQSSSSSGRSFDANKYLYTQTIAQTNEVSKFINDSLDAGRNAIVAAKNQSVIIDNRGINVGSNTQYQLRIIDSMLAMTDDNWEHAKLAIGRFSSPEVGEYWGVNADVIGGKLIVGNNLVIESTSADGDTVQFKVDSSGAFLSNAPLVLQYGGHGGKIFIHPDYGIAAGTEDMFTVDETKVIPSFVTREGNKNTVTFDESGFPEDANFYLDLSNGDAYFRGKLKAESGDIGGFTITDNKLYSGAGDSYVELTGGDSSYPGYTFWAGGTNAVEAPFSVKKDGTMTVKSGIFTGEINATKGTIGGWTITKDERLYAGSGSTYVALNGDGELYSDYAFWAGSATPSNNKFWIKKDGSFNATNGTFSGTLKANKIEGKLTASENGGALEGVSLDIGSGKFKVDSDGNLTLKGKITWGDDSIPLRHQYSVDGKSSWHDDMRDTDMYRRESLNGGVDWEKPYKFRGKDGERGENGTNANVTWDSVKDALHTAESTKTTFITCDSVGSPTIYGGKIYGAEFYAGYNPSGDNAQIMSIRDDGIIFYGGPGGFKAMQIEVKEFSNTTKDFIHSFGASFNLSSKGTMYISSGNHITFQNAGSSDFYIDFSNVPIRNFKGTAVFG